MDHPTTIDNDPGDEFEFLGMNACPALERIIPEMGCGGVYGMPIPPEPMTQDEVRDTLRGAAGDIEQAIGSAPFGEHQDGYRRVAKELRDWADEIESVQKARE